MKEKILSQIITECPWRDTLYWYDALDSTNTKAKELAKNGAPHGTTIIAGQQIGGRGRMGRTFVSPTGGMYLSVILRPNCSPDAIMHLTCAAAVAACQAVESVCGIQANIKWTNDLVFQKKKLGGILTELGFGNDGTVTYAVIGIGINCNQKKDDFPAEIQRIVTSVSEITGTPCSPAMLAAACVEELYRMDAILLSEKNAIIDSYRRHCITLGKEIQIISGEDCRYGKALSVNENGGLLVAFADGTIQTVTSGEVSVRGMYGYL
ncbi:MAG: biotin--[Oscillospiraceae bacterium]|nr:biotin--[acetyl-CoA-carboxylase] ligase [Oscillospiraceae bacterium]